MAPGFFPRERKDDMLEKEKQEWKLTKKEQDEFAHTLTLREGDKCAMEVLAALMAEHKLKENALWTRITIDYGIPEEFRYKLNYNRQSGKMTVLP